MQILWSEGYHTLYTVHRYRGLYWSWDRTDPQQLRFGSVNVSHPDKVRFLTAHTINSRHGFRRTVQQEAPRFAGLLSEEEETAPDGYPWKLHAIADHRAYRAAMAAYKKQLAYLATL